ncbi:ABC transporter permease [bacterium]|nr:ABC transporter permease [bacterium]
MDRGRIVLVTMGVVWGVLSLSIVLGFGKGLEQAMSEATVNSGVDMLRLWSGATTRPWQGRSAGSPIRFTPEDARYLEKAIPDLRGVSVEFISPSVPIEWRGLSSNIRLHGVDPIYQHIRRFPVQSGGRFLNRLDSLQRRRVAFLGDEVKERIFGEEEAVGEEIKLFGTPFTVVGVLKSKTTISNYEGQDRFKVLIPAPTFKVLRGHRWVSYMLLWLPTLDDDERLLKETYRVLGERHGFDSDDKKAIGVMNHVEIHRRVHSIVGSTRVLLFGVTGFGFLVSLVGVANVMFVMVEERRKEFGIQMALGARPAVILWDRLVEGILITVGGGLIGVLVAAAVIAGMNTIPMDAAARSYLGYSQFSIMTALGIASLLGFAGCFAGYWPARRAAAIDPVLVLQDQ